MGVWKGELSATVRIVIFLIHSVTIVSDLILVSDTQVTSMRRLINKDISKPIHVFNMTIKQKE